MKLELLNSFLKDRWMEFNPSLFYERLARWVLSVLILAILSSMMGGVVITILHLNIPPALNIYKKFNTKLTIP